MIIGIDFDETITRCPEFFALLTKALMAEGHTVLIITFRPDPIVEIANKLEGLGIAFTELITKSTPFSAAEFIEWKARICKERKVDILFEDMPDVAAAVEPPTVVMVPLDERVRRLMASIPWSEEE